MSLPTTTTVSRPQSHGYGARINELLLRLAPVSSQVTIESAEPEVQRINTADSPEEVGSDVPAHTLSDLTGGEGLYWAHRPQRSDRDANRFWRSRGINNAPVLPGETAGIRLLHDTETAHGTGVTNPYLTVLDGDAFYADADEVIRVSAPLTASPSPSTEDPISGTAALTGLVRMGRELYATSTDGVGKRTTGGSWSTLPSSITDAVALWSVKRRLLAATAGGSVLVEVDTTSGAGATVLTIPTGSVITAVVDAGPALLVASDEGVIYSLIDDAGTLAVSGQTEFGRTEQVTALAAAFGKVMVGTGEPTEAGGFIGRFYTADITADQAGSYVLANIALQRCTTCSDISHDHSPRSAIVKRDSIYMGLQGDTVTFLWRYHLATGSLTEDLIFGEAGEVYGLGVLDDRLVAGIGGEGLWREADTYVSTGYLIGPAADFFSKETKAWLQGRIEASGVTGGAAIELAFATSTEAMLDPASPLWTPVATIYSASQLGSRFNILGKEGVNGIMRITLVPSSGGTTTPIMQATTVFAYPQNQDVLVTLPVNVSDRIELPNRRPLRVPGFGDELVGELLALRGLPGQLEVYRPPIVVRGVVQRVDVSSPGPGRRGSGAVVTTVVFRGRLTSAGAPLSGDGSLGIAILGIGTMGV